MALSYKVRALAAGQATAAQQGVAYAALPDDREAFKTYLKECDECAIVPDVAGAFNAAWQIASHGQAPAQAAAQDFTRTHHRLIGDAMKSRLENGSHEAMMDSYAQAAPAAVAGPSDVVSIQRQAFIRGWDKRGMAHQLKGTVETDERMRALMDIYFPRTAAPTTQPAPQQEAPADELEEVLRERDDAEDFINELLDEVLGADRPEWSSAYNRYDAMNDVRERITALHKPAVDKAWGRFESAIAAPQPSPAAQEGK